MLINRKKKTVNSSSAAVAIRAMLNTAAGCERSQQADERSVLPETELLKKLSPHLVKLFDFHPTHVSHGSAKRFQLFSVASERDFLRRGRSALDFGRNFEISHIQMLFLESLFLGV